MGKWFNTEKFTTVRVHNIFAWERTPHIWNFKEENTVSSANLTRVKMLRQRTWRHSNKRPFYTRARIPMTRQIIAFPFLLFLLWFFLGAFLAPFLLFLFCSLFLERRFQAEVAVVTFGFSFLIDVFHHRLNSRLAPFGSNVPRRMDKLIKFISAQIVMHCDMMQIVVASKKRKKLFPPNCLTFLEIQCLCCTAGLNTEWQR